MGLCQSDARYVSKIIGVGKIMQYYGYKDTDLIPELKEWKKLNSDDFSLEAWSNAHSTVESFIALSSIMQPEFVEYQNGIFWKSSFEQAKQLVNENQKSSLYSFIDLQRLLNNRTVLNFIWQGEESVTDTQFDCVCKILVKSWTIKLKHDFPHLKTNVKLIDDDGDALITAWAE